MIGIIPITIQPDQTYCVLAIHDVTRLVGAASLAPSGHNAGCIYMAMQCMTCTQLPSGMPLNLTQFLHKMDLHNLLDPHKFLGDYVRVANAGQLTNGQANKDWTQQLILITLGK